ncbi:MAG: hypothetical protein J7485_14730, partial [Sphingobium sp.]|nr:hypothetical protein [Sphingobium sp.]
MNEVSKIVSGADLADWLRERIRKGRLVPGHRQRLGRAFGVAAGSRLRNRAGRRHLTGFKGDAAFDVEDVAEALAAEFLGGLAAAAATVAQERQPG